MTYATPPAAGGVARALGLSMGINRQAPVHGAQLTPRKGARTWLSPHKATKERGWLLLPRHINDICHSAGRRRCGARPGTKHGDKPPSPRSRSPVDAP